ncbi:hypothetical protein AB1L30_20775 [Bremerella sp. JC817]|uniref:hypothetical protein n=1 Tax=Bremerella sp. JC817 TaxID=3231756 RepID=UPI00345A64AC
MFRNLMIAGAVALAPLFAASTATAQVVTTVTPPTAIGYVPVRTGLFGLRTQMKPVLAPGVATSYVASPVVTTNYAPITTNYAPITTNYAPITTNYAPTTTYYTPEVTTYAAPEVTTAYYAPPVTTSYYQPAPTVAPATATTYAPNQVNYYRRTYWYSTPAPVPRSVGMPIIGY